MFSKSHRPFTRGEEEGLLGRASHELTIRSGGTSLTPTSPVPPPSPQAAGPLTPVRHSYYQRGNTPASIPEHSIASGVTVTGATMESPTIINDPYTGEPKARLVPDHPSALGSPFSLFEGCGTNMATQEKFWSHVSRIRDLQSEVARMHIAMESIGRQPDPLPVKEKEKDKDKPRKFRGQTRATNAGTDQETGHSASDTDHAGSGKDTRKTTTHPTTTPGLDTGEHFAKRQGAIQDIMKKLSELSQQISDFHQLPTPEISFPISPARHQTTAAPQTPPQPPTVSVSTPTPPALTHSQRPKIQHSPSSPLGQPPRLMIPQPMLGGHTQPVTPSKAKPLSVISHDGTFHESPASIQPTP